MRIPSFIQRHFSDPQTKRIARFRFLKKYAKKNDFKILSEAPHLIWSEDTAFCAADKSLPIMGVPDERLFTLFDSARALIRIDGDFAECGVRYGKSAHMMLAGAPGRTIHLFDSWEGLSTPTERDVQSDTGKSAWHSGQLSVDMTHVEQNLGNRENAKIYKGWIPERFSEVADRSFALVHIDVDLYDPTHDSLAFFYPRLVKGAMIVCDDYGFDTCPGAKQAMDEFFADKPEPVLHLATGQAMVMKQ